MRIRTLALSLAMTLAAAAPLQAQQAPPIRVDDTVAPLFVPGPDAARLARFDAFVASVRPPQGDPKQVDELFDKFLSENLQYCENFPDTDGLFQPPITGNGG